MPLPLLPRTLKDPTAQDKRERGAIAEFKTRYSAINRGILAILKRQTYRTIVLNAVLAGNAEEKLKTYKFDLSEAILSNISSEISRLIDEQILGEDGTLQNLWFLDAYVAPAYRQGTAQAYTNFSVQSTAYVADKPTLEMIFQSPTYQTRIGLVRARQFELMKGLDAAAKDVLGRTLAQGMAEGRNPLDIARSITERVGVEQARAVRIARTEINYALRTARLDEAEDTQERLGLRTMMMHLSALSATTRPSHRARHAQLYTIQQCRDWWAVSPNMINCKCSTIEVLVKADGTPLTPFILTKARKMLDDNPAPAA
jgi:SPP1 gp7 family putative phage head morphogenesis protein